jgi:hypothetical protein
MNNATFTKVSKSDKRLYGPRKLLICGFSSDIQPRFMTLLEMIGLSEIPKVWVTEDQGDMCIRELVELKDGTGEGLSSDLPRAIIMSGITQNELHQLMASCRKSGMKRPLLATLTPISETWTIQNLLHELAAEHTAMQKRKK